MADPLHQHPDRDRAQAVETLALLALLAMALRHYAYYAAPLELRAWAFNVITAGLFLVGIAWLTWRLWRHWGVYVAAWWAAEEGMTVGCGVAYMVKPWPVADGQDVCSSFVGTDLGMYGALVLAVLALRRAIL